MAGRKTEREGGSEETTTLVYKRSLKGINVQKTISIVSPEGNLRLRCVVGPGPSVRTVVDIGKTTCLW